MIGKLSDEVLLSIFRYYLDASPRFWLVLVHICHKWRRIVFASSQALRLRLFCTHGSPFLKAPDYWPSLPIVVEYGGLGALELYPPAPEDDDNIMAALERSDRVSSISLIVTSSLLEKLFAIESPFSELEHLVLLSRDRQRLTLPGVFGWNTQLRGLHLTGITFFALPQLLYSSRNLVDLQLHEVFSPWLFSPEALTDALSGMARLRSLALHFPTDYVVDAIDVSLLPRKRIALPALTHLSFRGIGQYLEGLVSGIDAPRLGDIEVTFTNEDYDDLELLELNGFINRIETPRSHHRVDILSSEDVISISLIQPGAPTRTYFELQLLCDQLFSMARISDLFSSFLFNVEDLRISAMQQSRWEDSEQLEWLALLDSFASVKLLRIAGDSETLTDIALQLSAEHETVLPTLHKLYIAQPGPHHAPLREAIVPFMTSRRLSGRPVEVEYEPLYHIREQCRIGPISQQVMLCDDVLLNIFRHYLDPTPRIWPTLAWVCQRWRQIVLASPLGLNLRLYCTYGTPVSKTLDHWPALPIVVEYGGFPDLEPPAPEDDDNIIAALKQSGRVSSISLTVTSSLLKKLSAISEPFSELEELALHSQDNMQLTLPSAFRWGPLLRTHHSTGIAFPSFPQLLSPCQNLVDLQLHEIPSSGYFPPEAFADALYGVTNLRTLSLHFLSLPPRRKYVGLPPPSGESVVLPALRRLKYRGTSKYLDIFVTRFDAPHLRDIDITFFSQPTMDALQLGRFIERIEMWALLGRAHVETSAHAISISFTNPGPGTSSTLQSCLQLQISCRQLDWQLSSMAQVCEQFSPFLFRVKHLSINTTQSPGEQSPSRHDDVGGEPWPGFVRSFGGTSEFWVAGKLTTDVLCALDPAHGGHTTLAVLPALLKLGIKEPLLIPGPSWRAVGSFITSRQLSGRPVRVYVPSYLCRICHASFRQQQELKRHLGDKHAYRIVCLYCNFEYTPEPHLFREHLIKKHPEVARNDFDALTSNPLLALSYPSQLDNFVHRHSSMRAPDVVASSTTVAAPHGIPTS